MLDSDSAWGVAVCAGLGVLLSALLGWILREYLLVPWSVLRRLRAQGMPGYSFRPVVGQLPEMIEIKRKRAEDPTLAAATHGTQFWFTGTKEFGRNWTFSVGPRVNLVLGDPSLARLAYTVHNENFVKTEFLTTIRGVNDGLLTASGPHWTRQRRLINPAFSHKEMRRIFPTLVECSQDALARLESHVAENGGTFNVDETFSNLTLDIICRAAFGSHLDSVLGPQLLESLTRGFPEFLEDSNTVAQLSSVLSWFPYLPVPVNFRLRKAEQVMNKALKQIISARLERHAQSQKEGGAQEEEAPERTDLLEIMMGATEGLEPAGAAFSGERGPQRLNPELLMANCITFLLAGHETTSQLLKWTSMLLSQHPEWQDKAREEVNALYAANGGKTPTFEQLNELKIVGWILNESLRLYPPASVVGRRCIKETVLSDAVTIPEGGSILIPIAVMHRDKDLWGPDADAFRPDRFSEGVSKAAKHPHAFMPFSVGPRNCIGQNFALVEAKIILAMFLRRFSWKLSKDYQHYPELALTLSPKRGMPLDLTILS